MPHIITVTNQKGGVAKTTTCATLAHGLALAGTRVLIVDLDPQGQVATVLGVESEPCIYNLLVGIGVRADSLVRHARENLDIIPGDAHTSSAQTLMNAESRPVGAIQRAISPLLPKYDYIIIDTSPSLGGLQERAAWAATHVLIPVATDFLAVESLGKTMMFLNGLADRYKWDGLLVGILPTLYDTVTKESATCLEALRADKKHTLAPIRRATVMRECAAVARTIWEYDPGCGVAQDYRGLVDAIRRL